MLLSVLIPVHNKLNLTSDCLYGLKDHLEQLNSEEISIVVIDDGSTDGTAEWIKEHFKSVHVLSGDGNLWWSGAMNMGARFAIEELKSAFLLLWNNDISFKEDYFSTLLTLIRDQDNSDTIMGSKILVKEDPSVIWSMGGYFNPSSGHYQMHGYYKPDGPEYLQPRDVDWLTGMGTIIPSQIVTANNYWNNKDFPQYHGDSDFTYRARCNGTQVKVFPQLVLFNEVKNSGIEHSGKWKQLIRLLVDNRSKSNFKRNLMFYRKHAKSPLAYMTMFSLYFRIFGGYLKWKLLGVLGIQKKPNQ